VSTWYYLVYSFEAKEGKTTELQLFVNNVQDYSKSVEAKFVLDEDTFEPFVTTTRSAEDEYKDKLNGFLYEFFIYQSAHNPSNTIHASTCIGTNCWKGAFDEYTDDSGTI
jgi:hypothetical protein